MQIINAPGKVTTLAKLVRRTVRRLTEIPGVSAIFYTEMADEDRAAALAADGWTVTRKAGQTGEKRGMGECAIVTRDDMRTVTHTEWAKITDGGGKGRLVRPAYAPIVITKAPSGRKTLLTNAHLPAHIEGIWARLPMPARIRVKVLFRKGKVNPGILEWIEAVHRWRQAVMDAAAEHHVDDIIVAPDGNVDAHKKWVREMLGRAWPGLNLAVTKKPDLGRRAVGWVLTTMEHDGGHVYEQGSSDHRAGRYVLKHINPATHNKPKPIHPPDPFERVVYNGALMDQKTKVAVQLMEKLLGYTLTILQGCYNAGGVSASAGTHDRGGVIDFAPFDWKNKVHAGRKVGWFIWHRLPIPGVWGEHIHGGVRNHGNLAPAAARQQDDYDGTPPRDGLASHSIDNTWHPKPPTHVDFAPAWRDLNAA